MAPRGREANGPASDAALASSPSMTKASASATILCDHAWAVRHLRDPRCAPLYSRPQTMETAFVDQAARAVARTPGKRSDLRYAECCRNRCRGMPRPFPGTGPGRYHRPFGSMVKRVPPGYPADHPDAELLRMRDVVFGRPLSDDEVLSPALPDTIADGLGAAMPVLRLLASLEP
jgi:hypothetical protein